MFHDGFAFPGDLGFLDSGGNLHIVGRDNVINIGGEKVDAVEVELCLNQHPAVSESLVYGAGEVGDQRVLALVVPARDDVGIDIDSLRQHCRLKLSDQKAPKLFTVVDKLPRDEFGKVVRKHAQRYALAGRG